MKQVKILVALALLISSLPLFAQDAGTNTVATPPPIPEEARKHFVMGETMFKQAKNSDDFAQAAREYKQAAELAPQLQQARYDLALAEEAGGDYSSAMADLKLYQQFKLSDDEARAAQDKIYEIEAKQQLKASDDAAKQAKENSPEVKLEKFFQNLDGGTWQIVSSQFNNTKNGSVWPLTADTCHCVFIHIHGHLFDEHQSQPNNPDSHGEQRIKTTFNDREFVTTSLSGGDFGGRRKITISEDGQSIVEESWSEADPTQPGMHGITNFQRMN